MEQVGRPRIRPEYDRRIAELVEEGLTVREVFTKLAAEVQALERNDYPSEPTVKGRVAAQRKKGSYLRLPETPFRWPESMGDELPWEASSTVLELVRYRDSEGLPGPSHRLAVWFWHVRQACPDTPHIWAESIAADLANWEFHNGARPARARWQWVLAYHPWRSEADDQALKKAQARPENALPYIGVFGEVDPSESAEMIRNHGGPYMDLALRTLAEGISSDPDSPTAFREFFGERRTKENHSAQ